ncbi:RCC1/BLIP-II protein, partial [Aureobasidium melanogenum]
DVEADAPPKKTSARAAANTKAKVTAKNDTDADEKPATTTARGRGRPKAADTKAAKQEEEAPKRKPGRPKKTEEAPAAAKATVASRKRKATATPEPAVAKKAKVAPKGPVINEAPTQRLDVFVCGEGSSGELGLGTSKKAIDVKRPRLNANLAADTVGVVQIVAGGMHAMALTHDNKILTWGVNDQGALGRDTTWEGGLRDVEDEEDSDSDDEDGDSGMNPKESTPTAISSDVFPEDTVFVQVAAGDSTSFALTDDGQVWGWGTFRSNEGIFGFTADVLVQRTPMLIPGLKKIKHISCGANHVLALDATGAVFAWGSGQQNQLGRR